MHLFFSQTIYAQNFTQANQFPLQLSPSLAGGKEMKRISIGGNAVNYASNKTNAFAVSYDQISKKLHSGIGFYYFQDNNNEKITADSSLEALYSEKYKMQKSNKTLGFCIAPKYNIYDKKIYGKIKYTFSPSIFLELGNEKYKESYGLKSTDYYSTAYSGANPNGIKQKDSTLLTYYQYNLNNLYIRSGIGLLLNSENLILLSKISFSVIECNEQVTDHTSKNNSSHKQESFFDKTSFMYSFEPTIHIGYTIRPHSKSKISLTPILGIGIKHYFNFTPTSIDSIEVYRYNISNSNITQCNYIHASANFRFSFLFLGLAYTKYMHTIHKGITIGYQSNNIKIMFTGATNLNPDKTTYSNLELSTGIFF